MKKAFLTALVLSMFSAMALSAHAAQPAQTLPSGVVVQIENPGTGAQPSATDRVTVNYTGTLQNGTVFDASSKHGGPITFGLNQVILAGPKVSSCSRSAAKPSWFARHKPPMATMTSATA